MKIAIDISQVAYESTGVSNYTKGMVRSLLEYDNNNNYLLFAYSLRKIDKIKEFINDLKSSKLKFETRLYHLPQSAGNLIWNKMHLLPLEKLIGAIDIYHSSDWIQIPSIAKKITTVHDLVIYKYPETSAALIIETQKRRMEHVKNECRIILSDSEATKKDLVDILNIDKEKIKVVYPGVSAEFSEGVKNGKNILTDFKITAPYILSVGTLDPRKNISTLISAYNKLPEKKGKPRLVIVTAGGWGDKIVQNKNIILINNINPKNLASLYSQASMFVYPSLYEGFGLPVVEAFSCGCPVITSSRGSLKEVAGDSALIVNPQKEVEITGAIKNILNDNKLRNSLIQKGFNRAKKFSWKESAGKIVSIYNSL